MNKRNAICLTSHLQHDNKYKGYKIMNIYAPWGAYLQ